MTASDLNTFDATMPDEVFKIEFNEYTLEIVKQIIAARATADAYSALLFYNGDHWQKGLAWTGPSFPEGHAFHDSTLQQIEQTFVSHNIIAEMVDRHVSGVLARELHWKFVVRRVIPPIVEKAPITGEPISKEGTPTAEEDVLINEAQLAVNEWWGKRNVLETLKRALAGLLCTKRAPLRFSIPATLRNANGELPRTDLNGALDYLYLDHMGFDDDALEQVLPSATVWVNKKSRQPVGVFYYDDGTNPPYAEVTFVDEFGNTVLKILHEKGENTATVDLPLGQRLLIYEMTRKALVSRQIMSQQKSHNKTNSMKDRNDTQGGYLERFILNAAWPTKKEIQDGVEVDVADTMYTGAGTTNMLQGASYVDELGITRVMNPSVQFRDPVPATTFIESANHTYVGMLQEGNQLHYASTDADISGESRKQARESYIKDLQASAGVIEGAVVWLLETALTEAAIFAGQPGRYDGLRAYAQCKIDPGPVSPDDMRVAGEMLDKGLWDWETAVSATGVDDVDTIKQRIAAERADEEARQMAMQNAQVLPDGSTPNDGSGDGTTPADKAAGGSGANDLGGATKGLNGIQINAAVSLLDKVSAGTITPENAIELLTALGIDRARAEQMVKKV